MTGKPLTAGIAANPEDPEQVSCTSSAYPDSRPQTESRRGLILGNGARDDAEAQVADIAGSGNSHANDLVVRVALKAYRLRVGKLAQCPDLAE